MIRKAVREDFERIMEIYDIAKDFMRQNGNASQWQGGYPYPDIIEDDIDGGNMRVITADDGHICACFGIFEGDDPTYAKIDGSWKSDLPYTAIHRVASDGSERGIFRRIFEYASGMYTHLRIDTHADNIPMQRAVTSCGFVLCGIIYVEDGTPRMAYEWISE